MKLISTLIIIINVFEQNDVKTASEGKFSVDHCIFDYKIG